MNCVTHANSVRNHWFNTVDLKFVDAALETTGVGQGVPSEK